MEKKLKTYYCIAFAQTLSTDQQFLFIGTNYGEILSFSVEKLHEVSALDGTGEAKTDPEPQQILKVAGEKVNSLSFFKDTLIVGLNGVIYGYPFKAQTIGSKELWRVDVPSTPENAEFNEINFMWLDTENGHLYAGCGDANIYGINMEDGKILRTYSGHSDYIHALDGNVGANQIVSASEDGALKFWDMRQKKATGKLEPYKKEQLNRPEFGKWQGTVSITDDWLVCGGGPRLSLWHLRSNEITAVFDFPGKVHVSAFLDDVILGGGDHNTLNEYNFNGDLVAEVPVSSSSVYSLTHSMNPKLLTIGGASNFIDVCTNFNYRDFPLKIYGNKEN